MGERVSGVGSRHRGDSKGPTVAGRLPQIDEEEDDDAKDGLRYEEGRQVREGLVHARKAS